MDERTEKIIIVTCAVSVVFAFVSIGIGGLRMPEELRNGILPRIEYELRRDYNRNIMYIKNELNNIKNEIGNIRQREGLKREW